MDEAHIKVVLDKLDGLKVAVIGDIMLDHYILGDSTRISPEAPVPVVAVDHDTYAAGGAANVALNLSSLGADVCLCGAMGKDAASEKISELMEFNKVQLDKRFLIDGISTIVKTRVLVRNQQLCRLDRESIRSDYAISAGDPFTALRESLTGADAVILSDYAKGCISTNMIQYIQDFYKSDSPLIALDPKPRRHLQFNEIGLMTPNRSESLEIAGITLDPREAFPAEEVCAAIWEKHKVKNLVITLGADGMLLCPEGVVGETIPTRAREVFDVSGAGDTVIAAMTLALAAGCDLGEAARFANTAAGVVVGKVGTAVVHPEEILALADEE